MQRTLSYAGRPARGRGSGPKAVEGLLALGAVAASRFAVHTVYTLRY